MAPDGFRRLVPLTARPVQASRRLTAGFRFPTIEARCPAERVRTRGTTRGGGRTIPLRERKFVGGARRRGAGAGNSGIDPKDTVEGAEIGSVSKNSAGKMPASEIAAFAAHLSTVAKETPATFNLTAGLVTTVGVTGDNLQTKITAAIAAKAAYHQAVRDQETARVACASAIAAAGRAVFSDVSLAPGLIAALGFKPHATDRTKIVPVTPIELTATPTSNGDLVLKWNRFTNAVAVNFIVESRVPGGNWRFIQDTTKVKTSLSGFPQGQVVEFRVSASKNGIVSEPSTTVTAYPLAAPASVAPAASPGLRVVSNEASELQKTG